MIRDNKTLSMAAATAFVMATSATNDAPVIRRRAEEPVPAVTNAYAPGQRKNRRHGGQRYAGGRYKGSPQAKAASRPKKGPKKISKRPPKPPLGHNRCYPGQAGGR